MATIHRPTPLHKPADPPAFFMAVVEEWDALLNAILHPARVVAEVEEVRALLTEADAVEASDPPRAAHLRRRAARIGVR